jgi:hypothetical protein
VVGVKHLAKGKVIDIDGYHMEILKIEGSIIIPRLHNQFNIAVKEDITKLWTKSLIVPFIKVMIKTILQIIGLS